MKKEYSVVNSRAPKLDAPDKSTGSAVYIDDIKVSGMLFGAMLHSPLAHARILHIDASRAERLPGVKVVVTSKDAGLVRYGVSPARYDETLFCHDKVRYVGDEVAAVAAIDLETAQEALSLIKVDYEELPPVLSIEAAMAEGAPLVHAESPGNVSAEVHNEFGDVEAALAQCDLVKSDTFRSKRQDGGFMEPQGCIAECDTRGYLTLRTSTQTPHYVQRTVAMVLGLPIGKVRVVKPYVGGGFGPKASANAMEMAACLMSIKTGKPVKMNFTREEVFLHGRARHQYVHTITIGVKKDGTIMAVKNECYMDGGAYSSFGIASVYYAGAFLGGPYRLRNMKYDGYRLYTNKPACGAQRGHSGVIARAALEQQLDQIAEELSIDPIELRLRNTMEVGEVSCNGLKMNSLGMRECLEAVRDMSGWKEKKGKMPKGKGIGMSGGFFVSGAGYPIYRSDTFHATVTTRLDEDGGTVHVYTGSADIGQGSDTAFAMITAEVLGIPLDWVKISSGDTDFGVDLGAYSSRQTLMTGHAIKEAALDVRRQILDVMAEELKVDISELDIQDGAIVFKHGKVDFRDLKERYISEHRGWKKLPERDKLTFEEAARIAFLSKGSIVGCGRYRPPMLGGSFKGAAVGTSPAYSSSAQIAEVSVDMETGKITVDKMVNAHDAGLAINLTSVEGQIEGALSMGLGEALFEEVKFDEKGRILNSEFAEYKIPTILDMPPVDPIVVETYEPYGPFGAKEVGEGAIIPTIPSIVNAVYDAIGIRFLELPLTPERVYMAIREKQRSESEKDE